MTVTEQKIQLIELDSTESTNNYAMSLIRDNKASNGLAILAKHQTKGKGQRGKSWKDAPGESINCSLILKYEHYPVEQTFHLVALTASVLRKVIEATLCHPVQIKWPNDIYINDKKAAGILIESITRGKQCQWVVIGFGINVNQQNFDPSLPNPISLKQVTGKTYDIKRLAEDCLNILIRDLANKPYKEIIIQYNKYLYKKHQPISLQTKEALINAALSGVDETGALILEGNSGYTTYKVGEVSWIN